MADKTRLQQMREEQGYSRAAFAPRDGNPLADARRLGRAAIRADQCLSAAQGGPRSGLPH